MGEGGEGAEVFKNLFGGFSESLSLFTNNPYQRKSTENVAGAESKLDTTIVAPPDVQEEEGSRGSKKKGKKRAGEKDDLQKGGKEERRPQPPEQKKKKKLDKLESACEVVEAVASEGKREKKQRRETVEKVSDDADGVSTAVHKREKKKDRKGKVQDEAEALIAPQIEKTIVQVVSQEEKKVKKKKGDVADETGAQNGTIENGISKSKPGKQFIHETNITHVEKEKRPKRKAVEDLEEKFEKKLRGLDGKKGKSKVPSGVQNFHSEDREIDEILLASEPVQEEKKKGNRMLVDEEDDGPEPIRKKKRTKKEIEEDEKKLLRTIFVGNLPIAVKKKHLIREFSQFGKVETARLRSVALVDTKLPRKAAVITGQLNEMRSSLNAYVVFEEEASAKAALAHNMSEFQGKHIRVDMATAPRKDSKPGNSNAIEYDRTRSIFVGNVPFDVEDESLYAVFANDNPELGVEAIRVPRDPQTSIGKGFGFVLFKTKAGAAAALAKKSAKLGDRNLRVVRMGNQQRLNNATNTTRAAARRSPNNISASRLRISGGVSSTPSKGPLPWEGTRSTKSDGRPGKWTLARQDSKQPGSGAAKNSGISGPAPKTRLSKRPAVAARKQAALVIKAGGVPSKPKTPKNAGAKRKKGEKGRKGGLKAKKFKK